MRGLRVFALGVLIAVLAPAEPAEASARLNLGAHYWAVERGLFDLSFSIDTYLVDSVYLGGRFGGAITTGDPVNGGVPLDMLLRFHFARRLYAEVTGGPWIFFDGDHLRGHIAFGFGLRTSALDFGLELGWLEPRAIFGARIGFRL